MNPSRKKIYFASDAHLGARFHKDPLAIEKNSFAGSTASRRMHWQSISWETYSTTGMNINM